MFQSKITMYTGFAIYLFIYYYYYYLFIYFVGGGGGIRTSLHITPRSELPWIRGRVWREQFS